MTFWKFRKNHRLGGVNKIKNTFIEPDEIFLDSKNLDNFDTQQFEGRIEKAISKKTINYLGIFFILIIFIFGARLINLQVQNGDAYRKRSENNTLKKTNIFAERGVIYDRNKEKLAWNKKNEDASVYTRAYLSPGFSHVLGYISYPAKDDAGNYWQNEFIGKAGLEKQYNEKIRGENGSKITETDARGVVHSENIINTPKPGTELITTIDSRVQKELFALIKNLSESNGFLGGGAVMMNVTNGEIIASTSFPEYNSEILSLGQDVDAINSYIKDKRKFFLDRNVSGLYTPGSVVKPFLGLGALTEGVIDQYKKILSTGSISIPNPFLPGESTIFKDWRVNGWTNMAEAIAVSSDVYFYSIGGGYKDQKGMGILNIEKYTKLFGMDESTGVDLPNEKQGVIPSPEWKIKNFPGDPWRIGNTYHTSIGQYGFQVTPIEMARAVSAIANYGKLVTPHFILGDKEMEEKTKIVDLKKEYFDIVHDGMRQAVTHGTAVALNVPYVKAAAKTGTAELGVSKKRVNSWIIGFFPYENPKYAFTVLMESGPSGGASASSIMRGLFDWMSIYTPEYFE